jgi:DNA-directed RNA polymerase subunit alpha
MKILIEIDTSNKQELKLLINLCNEFLKEKENDVLNKQIEFLEFTIRVNNCLRAENINLVSDLVKWSEMDLLKTQNFGKKSLAEIKETLKSYNLILAPYEKNA